MSKALFDVIIHNYNFLNKTKFHMQSCHLNFNVIFILEIVFQYILLSLLLMCSKKEIKINFTVNH
jgi:hypothetical protein